MALTVTTDLVDINLCEATTNWTQVGASGSSGAMAIEPDYFIQNANCISRGSGTASVLKGMVYDWVTGGGTALNFSSGGADQGKLIYMWLRMTAPAVMDTLASGGMQIVIASGATAPASTGAAWSAGALSAWYVSGGDVLVTTDGWICYVIDPTLPPSTTNSGGCDLTAVKWFGAAVKFNTGTAKGQTFGIDALRYGLGEIRCRGTNTTAGSGFSEMVDGDYGTIANRWGITTRKENVILVKGKIVVGDAISTNATTFTSQDETLIWEYPTYYDGTRVRPSIRQLNTSTGLSYFGLDFRGNGTGDTVVTLGAKVGSGDTASGRSGTTFVGSRVKTAFDFDDGAVEGVKIYGCTFRNIRGGIDMSANASTDEFIGNVVAKCGSFQAGPVQVRACSFIDNYGGASRLVEDFKNDGTAAQALSTADPSVNWVDRLNGSNWNVPAGVEYVELLDPGASDRREVTQIGSPDTGSAALTINVTAATGLFTRTTGSYLTDGFMIGMTVVTSGFTNAGNNTTKIIKSLTATILTVTSTTGLVDETGNNDERARAKPEETNLSGDHYAEAIINWPSAGANQGALGVCIRMSDGAGNAEDYYYLKCDLRNSQITLIRSDNGTDTTVDGPDAFTFAEDTNYLVHLVGRGTLIEGFVNGHKMSVTSSTYQTNLRVGIRGDAEADQTGDAPRLSRFGCGQNTDPLGAAIVLSATDNLQYNSFINNARATDLATTGTYSFTAETFSGNVVDLRDDSSGATTVNATTGSPAVLEEVDDAVTTVNNPKTYTLTNLIAGSEVRIFKDSDSSELAGVESSGTSFSYDYNYVSDTAIFVIIQKTNYEWLRINDTLTSTGSSLKVLQRTDLNYVNP